MSHPSRISFRRPSIKDAFLDLKFCIKNQRVSKFTVFASRRLGYIWAPGSAVILNHFLKSSALLLMACALRENALTCWTKKLWSSPVPQFALDSYNNGLLASRKMSHENPITFEQILPNGVTTKAFCVPNPGTNFPNFRILRFFTD